MPQKFCNPHTCKEAHMETLRHTADFTLFIYACICYKVGLHCISVHVCLSCSITCTGTSVHVVSQILFNSVILYQHRKARENQFFSSGGNFILNCNHYVQHVCRL